MNSDCLDGDDGEDFFVSGGTDVADDSDFFRSDSFSSFASLDKMGLVMEMKKKKYDRAQELVGELVCGDMILLCLRAYKWNHDRFVEEVLDGYEQVLDKVGVVLGKEGETDLALQDDKICYLCGQRSTKKRVPLSLREGAENPLSDKYDAKAAAKLCPVCCMPLVAEEPPSKQPRVDDGKQQMFECSVCWNDVPMDKTFALGCGHRFCEDCWKHYLEQEIKSPSSFDNLHCVCLEQDCKCPVPDSVFSRFIRDPVLLRKYVEQSLQQFVSCQSHYKWCPYPGCEYAVYAQSLQDVDPVTCVGCGNTYCFNCSDPNIGDHRPCLCEMARKWMEKATDEGQNIKWLMANTKQCPKCHSAIEKNGGCMHMTCRKEAGGCGYEFCWLCRGPWSEHGQATGGYYSCNKYDKSAAKMLDQAAAEEKSELDRYMFYYHRYDAHKMSFNAVMKQKGKLESRRTTLAKVFKIPIEDTAFLVETVNSLLQFFRALQYSYAYGYYIPRSSPRLALFEYSQENLEKYTNKLQELFEKNVQRIGAFFEWKEEIVKYTRLTTNFFVNFSRGVANEF